MIKRPYVVLTDGWVDGDRLNAGDVVWLSEEEAWYEPHVGRPADVGKMFLPSIGQYVLIDYEQVANPAAPTLAEIAKGTMHLGGTAIDLIAGRQYLILQLGVAGDGVADPEDEATAPPLFILPIDDIVLEIEPGGGAVVPLTYGGGVAPLVVTVNPPFRIEDGLRIPRGALIEEVATVRLEDAIGQVVEESANVRVNPPPLEDFTITASRNAEDPLSVDVLLSTPVPAGLEVAIHIGRTEAVAPEFLTPLVAGEVFTSSPNFPYAPYVAAALRTADGRILSTRLIGRLDVVDVPEPLAIAAIGTITGTVSADAPVSVPLSITGGVAPITVTTSRGEIVGDPPRLHLTEAFEGVVTMTVTDGNGATVEGTAQVMLTVPDEIVRVLEVDHASGEMSATFAEPRAVGHSATGNRGMGDIHVLDEGDGVRISSYTPAFAEVDGRKVHGAWLNPTAQRGGDGDPAGRTWVGTQPFTSIYTNNERQSLWFDASKLASVPIDMTAGDVLMIAYSYEDVPESEIQAYGAILEYWTISCVSELPKVGQTRPPYVHPDNDPSLPRPTYIITEADVAARCPSLPIAAEAPGYAQMVSDIQFAMNTDYVVSWADYNIEPRRPGTSYGRDYARRHQDAVTFLLSDASASDKLPIAREIAQAGIDTYAVFRNARAQGFTRIWEANGHHDQWRKFLIVIAGIILDDADMINVVQETVLDSQECFQEDGQYAYMTAEMIAASEGNTYSGLWSQYAAGAAGIPEWVGEDGQNAPPSETHYIWSAPKSFYRPSNVTTVIAGVLFVLASGRRTEWGPQAIFDYARRHQEIARTGIDPYAEMFGFTPMHNLPSPKPFDHVRSAWAEAAFDEHIASFVSYPWEDPDWVNPNGWRIEDGEYVNSPAVDAPSAATGYAAFEETS